jgi:hypothetical protein
VDRIKQERKLPQKKKQRHFKNITCSAPNDGILARTVPPAIPTQIKMPYVSGTQDDDAGLHLQRIPLAIMVSNVNPIT